MNRRKFLSAVLGAVAGIGLLRAKTPAKLFTPADIGPTVRILSQAELEALLAEEVRKTCETIRQQLEHDLWTYGAPHKEQWI